jgi:hypothetical protein
LSLDEDCACRAKAPGMPTTFLFKFGLVPGPPDGRL